MFGPMRDGYECVSLIVRYCCDLGGVIVCEIDKLSKESKQCF